MPTIDKPLLKAIIVDLLGTAVITKNDITMLPGTLADKVIEAYAENTEVNETSESVDLNKKNSTVSKEEYIKLANKIENIVDEETK